MIYPQDFRPKQNTKPFNVSLTSNNDFDFKISGKFSDKVACSKRTTWTRYCINSTVHGIRYLAEKNIRAEERYTIDYARGYMRLNWEIFFSFVWLVLITLAFVGTLYVSYLLQVRYSTNKLATVVETTMYPISSIPYPAVTICNNNRINWFRVPSALD